MKRTMVGVFLVAAFALGITASAGATAFSGSPELGECHLKKVGSTNTPFYTNNGCTKKSLGTKTDKYEWTAGPGVGEETFTSSGGVATLESVGGNKISCKTVTNTGKYNGAFEDETSVTFEGCESVSFKVSCQNTGAPLGQIKTTVLKSEDGYITPPKSVGVLLTGKAGPNLAEFECGGGGTGKGALVFVHGGVIAPVTVINKMEAKTTQKFKATKGIQKPTKFSGGPTEVLTTTTFLSATEKTEEQSGQTVIATVTNASPVEIRAEEK